MALTSLAPDLPFDEGTFEITEEEILSDLLYPDYQGSSEEQEESGE
jgi:hypothetical protein